MILVCINNSLVIISFIFFFQAEDGIRYLVRSRGLGDVYKRQGCGIGQPQRRRRRNPARRKRLFALAPAVFSQRTNCLLYTSDAADERSSVDLGGRRIIKKKNNQPHRSPR